MNTNGGTRSARRFCAASVIDEKFVQGDSHQADSAEPSESVLGLFRPAKYTLFNDKLGILRSSYQSEGTRKNGVHELQWEQAWSMGRNEWGEAQENEIWGRPKDKKVLNWHVFVVLVVVGFFSLWAVAFPFSWSTTQSWSSFVRVWTLIGI
jgi:hypothetical protein